jgi:cytochrome c oxidase assembly protein subunit 15
MTKGALLDQPKTPTALPRRGAHWMAGAAALFTLPLLYVGGSVTTYRVGLAVPDWPTTFGDNMFLYDFWNAPLGVRIEHAHRLYGAAVGLLTVLLAGTFLVFERRRWMKYLGLLAVAAVIVQGVLGGTRVTQVSTALAAVHGCVAQAFFALMVALWVLTGPSWRDRTAAQVDQHHHRALGVVLLLLVLTQIALGSWLRHFGTRPALVTHAIFALIVWAHALLLVVRNQRQRLSLAMLVPSARALGITSTLQIGLGIASLFFLLPFDGVPRTVTSISAAARTAHQTTGALLLAATVAVNLLLFRHLVPSRSSDASAAAPGPGGPMQPVGFEWEAVA